MTSSWYSQQARPLIGNDILIRLVCYVVVVAAVVAVVVAVAGLCGHPTT